MIDCMGNELRVDDLVQVTLSSLNAFGTVIEVKHGGIALIQGTRGKQGEQANVTMGTCEILVKVTVPIDPRTNQATNVVRIVNPKEKKETTKLLV